MDGFGQILIGVGMVISALTNVVVLYIQYKQNMVVQLLEKNTNSIKDALVKAVGEGEFAKGKLEGRGDPALTASAQEPIPVADKHVQDATERSARALERSADAAEQAAKPEGRT